MKIIRFVPYGDLIPPWMGVCWPCYDRCGCMVAPIGLNLTLAIGRYVLIWVKIDGPVRISKAGDQIKDRRRGQDVVR